MSVEKGGIVERIRNGIFEKLLCVRIRMFMDVLAKDLKTRNYQAKNDLTIWLNEILEDPNIPNISENYKGLLLLCKIRLDKFNPITDLNEYRKSKNKMQSNLPADNAEE
jgi:hypothetical protein